MVILTYIFWHLMIKDLAACVDLTKTMSMFTSVLMFVFIFMLMNMKMDRELHVNMGMDMKVEKLILAKNRSVVLDIFSSFRNAATLVSISLYMTASKSKTVCDRS
jgi:hypothetical protein